MPDPLITLTTDFGEASPYVAAMKGVVLGINPQARLIDLTHQIPPQDVRHAAFFLAEAVPCFPRDAIHVIVVDPGVGTGRALLYIEIDGHRLLFPDNGVCSLLARGRTVGRRIRLEDRRYWRSPISATFHGRDILAPVAGHLSLGLDPLQLGPVAGQWVTLDWPEPIDEGERIRGEVIFVDHFGNLITNIEGKGLPSSGPAKVLVDGHPVLRWVRTYGETDPGDLGDLGDAVVALVSSSGLLEVAVVNGNAAAVLQAGRGSPVEVWRQEWLA